jgi:copper chaperone CopZ
MATIIIYVCAAVLIAFAVWRTVQEFRGKSRSGCCGTAEVVTAKKVVDTDASHYSYKYRLGIEGMHCSNCARSVENALNSMEGVWARVNLSRGEAEILSKQPATEAQFRERLRKTGYSVTSYKAG